jgi:hypothetical protein
MKVINIAQDFSRTPGGRYRDSGPYSGEAFREDILLPAYRAAKKANEQITIDFSGIYGCTPGWIEEVFGGLIRALPDEFEDTADIIWTIKSDRANDWPELRAWEFMYDAACREAEKLRK